MDIDSLIGRGYPILFGILLIFSIIAGSISAWLTARYSSHHGAALPGVRPATHFLLFTSWWTFVGCALFLFLLFRRTGNVLTSVASYGIFLSLTWIFWFAGAIAISADLSDVADCFTFRGHVAYCGQVSALEGFAWASWIITTILLIVVIIRGISSLRRGDGARGQLVAV